VPFVVKLNYKVHKDFTKDTMGKRQFVPVYSIVAKNGASAASVECGNEESAERISNSKRCIQMNLTVSFFISGYLRESRQITTPCTIGRGGQSDWVLGHPMLSRKHCTLFDEEGELYICDNGSLNGTCHNGVSAKKPLRLRFGDGFTVGDCLRFLVTAPAEEEQGTATMELAEKSTIVIERGEFPSHLSTVLAKDSSP